jgi:hypothetical protein
MWENILNKASAIDKDLESLNAPSNNVFGMTDNI